MGVRAIAHAQSRCAVHVDYVTAIMRIYSEERFGPVIIVRVGSTDESVRVTDDTE